MQAKKNKIIPLKCTGHFQGPDPAEQENFICPTERLAIFLGPWGKIVDAKTYKESLCFKKKIFKTAVLYHV